MIIKIHYLFTFYNQINNYVVDEIVNKSVYNNY